MRHKKSVEDTEAAIQQLAASLGRWPFKREWNDYALENGYYGAMGLYDRTKTSWDSYRKKFGIPPARTIFTEDQCIAALRRASESLGTFFTRKDYAAWQAALGEDVPTSQQIQCRCGGFNSAKEKAGLLPNSVWGHIFSEQEMRASLLACAAESGSRFTEGEYDTWRSGRKEVPCVETIRRRFSGFNRAKDALLLDKQEPGPRAKYDQGPWREEFVSFLASVLSIGSYEAWARENGGPSAKAIRDNAGGYEKALLQTLPLYMDMVKAGRRKRGV